MQPDPIEDCESPGAHIWGWMGPVELDWLHDQAATMRNVAEIGCLRGRSAYALLTGCPGPVYCIDPWEDPGDICYEAFMENCGHFKNLRAVKGWSPAAAQHVPKVDMVFIDGDHSYEAVVADLDAWIPKTRRLICGHDYCDDLTVGYPGVYTAVHERFTQVVNPPGTSIWVGNL